MNQTTQTTQEDEEALQLRADIDLKAWMQIAAEDLPTLIKIVPFPAAYFREVITAAVEEAHAGGRLSDKQRNNLVVRRISRAANAYIALVDRAFDRAWELPLGAVESYVCRQMVRAAVHEAMEERYMAYIHAGRSIRKFEHILWPGIKRRVALKLKFDCEIDERRYRNWHKRR